MRILVVVGECLRENSSANLCHLKYIDGLVKSCYDVDLLTVSSEGLNIDKSMPIPAVSRIIEYRDSLYKRSGEQKKTKSVLSSKFIEPVLPSKGNKVRSRIKRRAKAFIRRLYGPYGIETGWLLRAVRFQEKEPYDLLISLSYPPVSHRLAEILLLTKRVRTGKWVQIWEDPWYADLGEGAKNEKVKAEEGRVIGAADLVYYVSPLTFFYQKQLFPKHAGKMRWQPLPAYYEAKGPFPDFSELRYGYFGDYVHKFRNLEPFYRYAVENDIPFTICGNSNAPFVSAAKTVVYPRITLEELKPIEEDTNVLVFLCNLRGGQIPGKIYQYSATNKYILFILDGTEAEKKVIYDYFEPFKRYVFCENTGNSIAKAITVIRKGDLPESYHTALGCFSAEQIIQNILQEE